MSEAEVRRVALMHCWTAPIDITNLGILILHLHADAMFRFDLRYLPGLAAKP